MSIWDNKHIDRAVRKLVDELERHFLAVGNELLDTDERKVVTVTTPASVEGGVLVGWFECPNCGDDMIMRRSNYCSNCGCRLRHLDGDNDA